jgi:hypothetical protein
MRQVSSGGRRSLLPAGTESEKVYTSAIEESHLRDYWTVLVKRRDLIVTEPQNHTVTGIVKVLPSGSYSWALMTTIRFSLPCSESRTLAAAGALILN